tara:strand:- start:178 stop:504 length:327 start_codon:yes stop_codon:yes gene_type:complete
MATTTSDAGRPPLSKRRKVTGSRNRAQESKRAKSYRTGRQTVGGAKPQPKSKKVTLGSGAKNRLRGAIRVASTLLKKGSVAGYIAGDLINPRPLADGTLKAYRSRSKK